MLYPFLPAGRQGPAFKGRPSRAGQGALAGQNLDKNKYRPARRVLLKRAILNGPRTMEANCPHLVRD